MNSGAIDYLHLDKDAPYLVGFGEFQGLDQNIRSSLLRGCRLRDQAGL